MLSDQDLMTVQSVSEHLTLSVILTIHQPGTGTLFEANLDTIARQISGVSMDRIRFEQGNDPVLQRKPSLTLSNGQVSNIHYLAAPEGSELGPFLDAVGWLGNAQGAPAFEGREKLKRVDLPVHVLVLMAQACPHCPQAVRAALMLAVAQPSISVIVADSLQFPDLADRYKVKSTPTIVINDGFTLVGQVTVKELAQHVLHAVGSDSLTEVLDSMIKSGRAEDAAELLCNRGQPAAILPIYMAREFSARIGALVAMEAALERNPRSLDPIVEALCDLLSQDEAPLRGDTAELLGKIGDRTALSALRKIAFEDSDLDVREAAQEAVERLEEATVEH